MRTTLYSLVCKLNPFSSVQLCATLWIVARQAPLSMGLSQQEYWNGLPFPPPGDFPDPAIKLSSPDGFCIGRQILYH